MTTMASSANAVASWNPRPRPAGASSRIQSNHRRERQRRFVGHAEGNVQIAQPDIEVDRQDAEAVPRQTGGDPRTEGRLSRAALSGDQRYDLSQRASLPQ